MNNRRAKINPVSPHAPPARFPPPPASLPTARSSPPDYPAKSSAKPAPHPHPATFPDRPANELAPNPACPPPLPARSKLAAAPALPHGCQFLLIRLPVRFQPVRLVRLPHIKKLPRSFCRVLRDIAQPPARLHHRLHRQRLVKRDPHAILHTQTLLIRFRHRLLALRVEDLPVETQLAAQDHVLLYEHSLLASTIRSAANLIAAVPDRRIRPQSGLPRPPRRRTHSSLCLRESRIIGECHLLQLFQRQPTCNVSRGRLLRKSILRSSRPRRFLSRRLLCRSGSGNILRRHHRWQQRAHKSNLQQIPKCLESHHQSPVFRAHQTQSLALLARTVHPRHRCRTILPPLFAQSLNLVIALRRQDANQCHHPLHVPAPSRTQPVRFRLLHHRVHRHRRAFHERVLRKSRYRIRILTNVRLPHLHPAHPWRGLLRRRRLRRRPRHHCAVCSRLRQCRSNTHAPPHARSIFRRRRRTFAHHAHALLHPRACRHSRAPRHRPRH